MRCTDAVRITAWASAPSAGERRQGVIVRQSNSKMPKTFLHEPMAKKYMDTSYTNQADQVRLRVEIRERTLGYMIGAFGLVAGLAWNEAIQGVIAYLFPLPENTLPAKFLYAVMISVVVVMISVYISRLFHRFDRNQ